LSEELIEKKLDYCRQLLKLADVIEPGSSQLRDHLLFELQSVTEHKANRAFKRGSAEFKVFTIHCGIGLLPVLGYVVLKLLFFFVLGIDQGRN
jgi:hypothetical protein